MKGMAKLVCIGATLALMAMAVGAVAEEVDLSGNWAMTMEGESPSGQKSASLSFEREGHNLVATMQGEGREVKCQGYIDGNASRFYCIRPTTEGEFVAEYTGHVAGDLMGARWIWASAARPSGRRSKSLEGGLDQPLLGETLDSLALHPGEVLSTGLCVAQGVGRIEARPAVAFGVGFEALARQ